MLTPNQTVVPPGGFHYIEKHDGIEIRLVSHSYEMLTDVLLRYRVTNGLPPGDPKQDVIDYVCKSWPHFCHDSESPMLQGRDIARNEPLLRRASSWMTLLYRIGSPNNVQQDEAERRARICGPCPLNVEFRSGGCVSCTQGLDRVAFVWLKGKGTIEDSKLQGCAASGQLNLCAVHAKNLPPLSADDAAALAPGCWRKT